MIKNIVHVHCTCTCTCTLRRPPQCTLYMYIAAAAVDCRCSHKNAANRAVLCDPDKMRINVFKYFNYYY